jgi:cell division septum initiation protein DivIVA
MGKINFSIAKIGYNRKQIDAYLTAVTKESETLQRLFFEKAEKCEKLAKQSKNNSIAAYHEAILELENELAEVEQANKEIEKQISVSPYLDFFDEAYNEISETIINAKHIAVKMLEEETYKAEALLEEAYVTGNGMIANEQARIASEMEASEGELQRLKEEKQAAIDEISRIRAVVSKLSALREKEITAFG